MTDGIALLCDSCEIGVNIFDVDTSIMALQRPVLQKYCPKRHAGCHTRCRRPNRC